MSSLKQCPICFAPMAHCFDAVVLKVHNVQYFRCDGCGLVQTEKPFWSKEAYSETIAVTDTGLVARNVGLSKQLTSLLFCLFDPHGRFLDIAGGTGLFTRLMRDIGFDFYWSDSLCTNIHARGFEFSAGGPHCKAVTAFEVLEHLEDPVTFVRDSLATARTDTFIFTTELYPGPTIAPKSWWYYSFETGQHISFYQTRTLVKIAAQLGMTLFSSRGLHMFTRRRISHFLFKILTGRPGKLGAPLIRRLLLSSRTMSDHDALVNALRNR